MYVEVEIGPQDRSYIEEDDLELVEAGMQGPGELITSLRFGGHGDLARILTFHKISSDLSNVFYAMQASRTDFYAYQFKPVYKFIESLNGRLLITDEVGLGKTIEAGLIWTEMRARSDARRLLVVCPSMLREKWKKELKDRFNVTAQIHDTRSLLSMVGDFVREGDNFQCAAICSLQAIRQGSVQNALEELEGKQYRFDLVIIDEAHHMRNVSTMSHQAGRRLSDLTEAMVMLTATPIHLKNEDLFRLLSILDATEFNNQALFELRLKQNEPVVRAQNALRRRPADLRTTLDNIEFLKGSRWFRDNPLVPLTIEKIRSIAPGDTRALVETGRLLENLNLFGSMISRTRKREVQEWRVFREPMVLSVRFNEKEAEFYNAVTDAVQDSVSHWSGSWVGAFALMMPQRQMASSIPAMVEHYAGGQFHNDLFDDDMLSEVGLQVDEDMGEENGSVVSAVIKSLVSEWDRHTPDSKFDTLSRTLRRYVEQNPESKIIVFSYFKKTLAYLQRRLRDIGFQTVIIHGDVSMEERQQRLEVFKCNSDVNALLSSEVGSEGIDLQFCNVLVNYDLPWNPMKVEQRIGRLDRLGQKADKITIINLAVEGTIEERILDRLYNRIGIFENSIGDLEPILGSEIQELSAELLSQRLTEKQIEDRIAQTQLAIEQKRQMENDLVEQSSVLFGSSDYILEQIDRARRLGRWITPEDLKSFVDDFFNNAYPGTNIYWDKPEKGLVGFRLSNEARNDLATFCRTQTPVLFTNLTQPSREPITIAFRSAAAQENPRLEMLMHFHSLIQWIIHRHRQNPNAFFPTAAIELETSLVPPGLYLIVVEFREFVSLRREVQMAAAVSPLGQAGSRLEVSAEELIQEILNKGRTWEFANQIVDAKDVAIAWEKCTEQLGQEGDDSFQTFKQRMLAIAQQRKSHLESYRDRKGQEWRQRIQTLRDRTGTAGQIKGFESALQQHLEHCQAQLERIERESQSRPEFKEIAALICKVIKP
jgi:superfamily II DNA or RNA helicase